MKTYETPEYAIESAYKNGYAKGYEDGKRDTVKKGCEYCSGEFVEYQHTVNTKLNINTFGKAQTLVTECTPCPPYAKCCLRGIPARSAFIINFCPNCGKDLRGEKDA